VDEPGPEAAAPADVRGWCGRWEAFLRRERIRGEALVCLPEEWVAVRSLQAPEVAEVAQDDVNRFEAVQALPTPLADRIWDCEGSGPADGKVEVVVVSVPQPSVEALAKAMEEAGCFPRRVLAPAMGLLAWTRAAASGQRATVVAGEADLTLLVAEGRRWTLRHRRRVMADGEQRVTHALGPVARLRLPSPEPASADAARVVPAVPEDARATLLPPDADRLTEDELGWLQLEMARAQARFRGGRSMAEALVIGNGLTHPEALAAVAARLRLPVRPPNEGDLGMAGLEAVAGTAAAARLAGAFGLASRAAAWGVGPCLLPAERKRSLAWRRRQTVVAGFAAAAALALVPPTAVQTWRTGEARKRAAQAEDRVRRLAELAEANRRAEARLAEAEASRRRAGTLLAERSRWTGLLADLQSGVAAVEDAWLESVQLVRESGGRAEMAEPSYRIVGHILDRGGTTGAGSSESRLRRLLGSIVRSPWVARLEQERFQRREDGRLRFEVQLALVEERAAGEGPR
jgi:hypothetical protein